MTLSGTQPRPHRGSLYVFEGPDGVGKTTIAARFAAVLGAEGPVAALSFPGREPGSLGQHVYELHHDPRHFGIEALSPASLQLLHVAAHIDAISARIVPLLDSGTGVVLDRFWWSTWVYGLVDGADRGVLRAMVDLERVCWGHHAPAAVFLLTRPTPLREETTAERWFRLTREYDALAATEAPTSRVVWLPNDAAPDDVVARAIVAAARARDPIGVPAEEQTPARRPAPADQLPLVFPHHSPRPVVPHPPLPTRDAWAPAEPTSVFDTFWHFAAERQAVFFRRARREPPPWTADPILAAHKFTNAYRASDRVSQFLIRRVLYDGDQQPAEIFFRAILFKLFNRIDTWCDLARAVGPIAWADYSYERYDAHLLARLEASDRIYSAAYIMPAAERTPGARKHQTHLRLLERMMHEGVPERLAGARSLREAFEVLRSFPMLGNFLAYQYVIDLNYSELVSFSEMEFIVPGPGALDGIRKCFAHLGGLTEADLIRRVAERQEEEFAARGLAFETLWGRPLQLVDCQNLFCEISKYARVYHPDVAGLTGRTRIKQRFRPSREPIAIWYPPKWGINDRVAADLGGAGRARL